MAGGRTYYEAFPLASSGTVSDETVTSDWFHNHDSYKGCVMVVERTVETGTATLNAKLQGYHHATGTVFDVANADIIALADGDAGATGLRYTMVYPGITGAEADGLVSFDTNFNYVNGFLPDTFRVSVTHGGTSIVNTFAVTVYPLR
jgi:hypothetical protein